MRARGPGFKFNVNHVRWCLMTHNPRMTPLPPPPDPIRQEPSSLPASDQNSQLPLISLVSFQETSVATQMCVLVLLGPWRGHTATPRLRGLRQGIGDPQTLSGPSQTRACQAQAPQPRPGGCDPGVICAGLKQEGIGQHLLMESVTPASFQSSELPAPVAGSRSRSLPPVWPSPGSVRDLSLFSWGFLKHTHVEMHSEDS